MSAVRADSAMRPKATPAIEQVRAAITSLCEAAERGMGPDGTWTCFGDSPTPACFQLSLTIQLSICGAQTVSVSAEFRALTIARTIECDELSRVANNADSLNQLAVAAALLDDILGNALNQLNTEQRLAVRDELRALYPNLT